MLLVDVLVAGTVLLVILVPAAQLLMTSGKVITNNRAQAVAGSLATNQIAQDRAAWTSTTATPSYTSSNCGGSAYTSTTKNSTFNLFLTACDNVNGEKFWIFQNGGWCVTNASSVLKSSGTGTEPLFWVEVMVVWGGVNPPSPTTVVSTQKSVVMSSALLTPNGYYTGGGSTTSPGCPL